MRSRFVMTAALLCGALSAGVAAQQFPNRPVRIVVGFVPGGSPDASARILGPQLAAQMGQQIVADGRSSTHRRDRAPMIAPQNGQHRVTRVTHTKERGNTCTRQMS